MITFWRILLSGATNFIRNSWLTIAATAVMVVAIMISLSAVVLNVTAKNAITELSKNLQVSVYFTEDVTEDQRSQLTQRIASNEYVDSVDYISKQEAQIRLSASFGDDDGIVEGLALVGADTLPESLEISVSDLDKIEEVGGIATNDEYSEFVDSVSLGRIDAKKTIDRASSARDFIVSASIVSALAFGAVSVLIIFNTIRMAIFTRAEEIRIMKLIGATPSFIRGPFLVEASLYGIISGLIAVSSVYTMIVSLGSKVSTQAEFEETYAFFLQDGTMWRMVIGAILGGILVAVVSSLLAMNRYLRLKNW
ncbi:MAG: permease-like cell division protein FtsX [Patescibacteria group bacterium]